MARIKDLLIEMEETGRTMDEILMDIDMKETGELEIIPTEEEMEKMAKEMGL
jgi:hypothetical protein